MTTTLLAAEEELSKQIGDYWASTTTTTGTVATTLTDTALKAKEDNWITDEAYDMLLEEPDSAAAIYEERKITSLAGSTGILTVLAHGGVIESGIDYRVHRLFPASEKRRALVSSAKKIYPHCFKEIWDESLVCGNWLKDGSFERWTSGALTDWTETDVTTTDTTDSPYYKHGTHSCKLSGSIGNIACSITNFDDLKHLAGKTVTFTVQGWSDTASCLRISIYDGTTRTYSDYHDELSAWTAHNEPLTVTQVIAPNPTEITFKIYHAIATTATSYVDDARVISDYRSRLYIGHLGLARNRPHQVYIEPTNYSQEEGWIRVRDYKVDKDDYLYIPTTYPSDYRLRIRGIGYLDFLASGVSSTAWTATIDIDSPQLEILVAEAAIYLCNQMIVPNFTSGESERWIKALGYWQGEYRDRCNKFGMIPPSATVMWGI